MSLAQDGRLISKISPITCRKIRYNSRSDTAAIMSTVGGTRSPPVSAHATVLAPHRAEGFGIPLVEAMQLGTPVVVSDIPVFREVGADAAVFVDPDDVAGFVAAVRELDDPGCWVERSAAARARAAGYTWDASARILLALLERTAARR